jgi:glycosyltransferase involved in cell wall biosynthesis
MCDVSVVIPTYNRKRYLERAIASCFEENDGIQVEVVVVDDGSTDGTRAYLRDQSDERIRPVFQDHRGAQAARNRGINESTGSAVKFLDDDDWLYPRALEKQYGKMVNDGADVVYGDLHRVAGEDEVIGTVEMAEADDMLKGICRGQINTATHPFLYSARLAGEQRWREDFSHYGDDTAYAFGIAAEDPEIGYVPGPVAAWYIHDGDRITDGKLGASPTARMQRSFDIIEAAYEKRCSQKDTDESLDRAVANALWHHAWKMAPFDFARFRQNYHRIRDHFPGFDPPRTRRIERVLDQLGGAVFTEALAYVPRRVRAYMR